MLHGMISLPNTSAHDQRWESKPWPLDLESVFILIAPNHYLLREHPLSGSFQPLSLYINCRQVILFH